MRREVASAMATKCMAEYVEKNEITDAEDAFAVGHLLCQ